MLKRHSRLIVLFTISFACVAINMWLIMTGHYRLPALVFALSIIGGALIIKWLPPVTTNPQEIRKNQLKAAAASRRLAWIYVAGLVFGTLKLISDGAKGVTLWPVLVGVAVSTFLIWSCFTAARRLKEAAAKDEKPND